MRSPCRATATLYLLIFAISLAFTPMPWAHPAAAIGLSSFMFSQFGVLAAIYATNFDIRN